jgi:hypothetical protein
MLVSKHTPPYETSVHFGTNRMFVASCLNCSVELGNIERAATPRNPIVYIREATLMSGHVNTQIYAPYIFKVSILCTYL